VEARLVEAECGGLVPDGPGWFILNARAARWVKSDLGTYGAFENTSARFPQFGLNLKRLEPGQPSTMYHRENAQEGFLVLAGECVLIVEGEERLLGKWDYFHCPPGVAHVIVGAGSGPSLVLAIGARGEQVAGSWVWPTDPVAQRRGAGVPAETSDPRAAYADVSRRDCAYQEGWLPG
jgi:uncharacterized cupin superfamily protein